MHFRITAMTVAVACISTGVVGIKLITASGRAGEKLSQDARLINFGVVHIDGGRVARCSGTKQHPFTFRNATKGTLHIDAVVSDCMCMITLHEEAILSKMASENNVSITPISLRKHYFVVVRASQGKSTQVESVAVDLDVFEENRLYFDPPTILIGELIANEPFEVEQVPRITSADSVPIYPESVSSPEWLNVGFKIRQGSLVLNFSGRGPGCLQSRRDFVDLVFPVPYNRQSLEFSYSTRSKYVVNPHRLFGSANSEKSSSPVVVISGLQGTEEIEFCVEMQKGKAITITTQPKAGHFLITPIFQDYIDEVSGAIKRNVYSE